MAVTQQPPVPLPGAGGPAPTWDAAPPAVAGRLSQAIALTTVGLALWLAAAVTESPHIGLWAVAVLAASVAVGIATGAERAFRGFPGLTAALVTVMALVLLGSRVLPDLLDRWGLVLLYVPLIPVGLDWQRVGRLQATIAVAAFLIIPVSMAERSGWLAVTLGWFAVAAASLWCLEQDRRRGEDRPQPLVPGAADPDQHPGDLLRTLLPAIVAGLLAALLLSVPSCNPELNLPPTDAGRSVPVDPGDPGAGDPGAGGADSGGPDAVQPGDGTATGPGGAPGTGPGAGGGTGNGADQSGTPPSAPRVSPWWLLAVVALAAAVAWFWWRRSRTPPPLAADREWAVALVERIDQAGKARGLPRPGSSTVLAHTDHLAGSVLPDPRLRSVGRLLSDALFGQTAVSAHTRMWAQAVVDEILEAHPAGAGTRARARR